MKIHHAQTHHRSLNHHFRDLLGLFEQDYAGRQVLLTTYHDETASSTTLYGTLQSESAGRLSFDTGDQTWEVLWLGGANPAGYYVYPEHPVAAASDDAEHIGRVVRLQLVGEVRLDATDDGLETTFENCTDLVELLDSAP